MDPNLQALPNNEVPRKDFKALASRKVEILEIIFVAFVTFLLFATLNYFNILSVSDLSPKYLAWLPKQTEFKIPAQTSIDTQRKPLPTPASKSTFQYDTKKAEVLLTQYIKDNIKPEFLLAKIEVKHRLVGTGKQEGTEYTFGANWKINEDFFQSNFHYTIHTNNPDDIEFLIHVRDTENIITMDSLIATSLTNKYLKNISSDTKFDCKTVNTSPTTTCENFSIQPQGKKGYGTIFSKQRNLALLFSCFVPTDAAKYSRMTSCLLL